MTHAEIILRLAALTIFSSYLFFKHRQRLRRRPAPKDLSHLAGHALDAAQLQPRLQHLRDDYLAERDSSRHSARFRKGLVSNARRAIGCLAFFRNKKEEHENQTHFC